MAALGTWCLYERHSNFSKVSPIIDEDKTESVAESSGLDKQLQLIEVANKNAKMEKSAANAIVVSAMSD